MHLHFLPARRYSSAGASADTSYGPVSVCLSVYLCLTTHKSGVLLKLLNGPSCFFGSEASSHLQSYNYSEIRVSPKIRVLSSGTLSQTPDLENFASAYRSSKPVIDLAG